jgi:hypothetical protein
MGTNLTLCKVRKFVVQQLVLVRASQNSCRTSREMLFATRVQTGKSRQNDTSFCIDRLFSRFFELAGFLSEWAIHMAKLVQDPRTLRIDFCFRCSFGLLRGLMNKC